MGTEQASAWSFANALRGLAAQRPDHDAFVYGSRRETFAELHKRSSRAANAMRRLGVTSGDRVAVLLKNGCEFFEVAFAASKLDATLVALNWRLSPPELAAIIADAQPSLLIVDPDFVAAVDPGCESPRPIPVLTIGEEYERWLEGASDEDPQAPSAPDSVALVLYSSGTTGRPKGIMLTNENLSYIEVMARELFRMTPDSVHLVVAPLFHIGGAGTGLTTTMLGGCTVILSEIQPDLVLETIERERVTHAFFVPTVIQRLIEAPAARERDLSSLRYIAYGAAPMTETLLRNAMTTLGCGFIGCYGMTETAGTVVALAPEEHVPDGPGTRLLRSVGRPLPWHTVRVTDMQSGEEAAVGEPGEIWVRSRMNMKGYFNQPETTAQAQAEGGWIRTGDGAYRDEDGYIYLTDRLKDMIITGGENVYPAEVENVLGAHPDVAEAAVIGIPHPTWGETVKAVVALRPGAQLGAEQLIRFSRDHLAPYKCPTTVDFVDVLPRNPSGKIVKQALRERYGVAVVGSPQ